MANKRQAKKRRKQVATPKIKQSVNQLLNIDNTDFNNMNEQQMRQAVQTLASAANKRIKRLKKRDMRTPALDALYRTGTGKFSTRGLDLNGLRREYAKAKTFLSAHSSTVRGYQNELKKTQTELANYGVNVNTNQLSDLFRVYAELSRNDKTIADREMKYQILQAIADEMNDTPTYEIDQLISKMQERIQSKYEENEVLMNEFDGVSGFFELE